MLAFAVACCFCCRSPAGAIGIEWGESVDLGPGAYARAHPLADGRLMAVYSTGGGIVARFASRENPRNWSGSVAVAGDFTATNGSESVRVGLANAEFAQLETGRIVCACNLRPDGWRHDIHPCAIAVSTSDDAGRTWSPLRTVYRAVLSMPADGSPRGCYEPFVLPLGGARAQIYFADETPFEKDGCAFQEISVAETADGGETWSVPRRVCFTDRARDGMPTVADIGAWRYLAVETNPGDTKLHPQIVRCSVSGGWDEQLRFEPLAEPPDWRSVYGGAPYIAATESHILLSWQESGKPGDPLATSLVRVAVLPKEEVGPDGSFTAMRGVYSPQGADGGGVAMLWNSLCAVGGDEFIVVSQCGGRIVIFPGKVISRPARHWDSPR